jgi:predicted RNA polymerase sigma factor
MNLSAQDETYRAIECVARESYGRLVAYLSAHTHDVAGAEDALSEALCAALATWPRDGVPVNPGAWLLTTARHALVDRIRHQRVVLANEPTLRLLQTSATEATEATEFPDERLKLLFVCAHPAIDPAMHTPLMLQAVLGLDAARIAKAFVVAPATMGQRLVRAKTKIRRGGLQFEVPDEREWTQRLDAVLEAVYAAFGIGWEDVTGMDQGGPDLAEEAIWLARVLLELMPGEAEVRGLLALMLYCESRRGTRRGPDGRYLPLSKQDPRHWSVPLITEAEQQLAEASRHGRTGRFQLEAAIQSVHAERARTGRTEWEAIALFYTQLLRHSPTVGSRTGYAAAVAEANGPEAGMAVLDAIEPQAVSTYQPYWAVRAHLCQWLGRTREAEAASERAIDLAEDPAVRQFLFQEYR